MAFNCDLNHSDLGSTLDAMNFQKWQLFSGSRGILVLRENCLSESFCSEVVFVKNFSD